MEEKFYNCKLCNYFKNHAQSYKIVININGSLQKHYITNTHQAKISSTAKL